MRVLVDGVHLGPDMKGIGHYAFQTLTRLVPSLSQATVFVLVQRGNPALADASLAPAVTVPVAWRNHLWHGYVTLPHWARRVDADVVWIPYETAAARLGRPYVMTIHDVPQEIRRAQGSGRSSSGSRRWLSDRLDDLLLAPTLRRAAVACANSRYVSNWLSGEVGVDPLRICLAPCAPAVDFEAMSRVVDVDEVRRRLGLIDGYVLTIYTGDPRESPVVLAALVRLLSEGRYPQGLVVAGVRAQHRASILTQIAGKGLEGRRHVEPFVGPEQLFRLAELYTAASVYVDPSLHEGFGMQVVEAMATGTPVVCFRAGAMPEVTAGTAVLVDAGDGPGVERAVESFLADPERAARFGDAGRRRSRCFSWDTSASVVGEALVAAARG